MKKIKKLLKFIPVICLSVLSGLSAFFSNNVAIKSTYADNNVLISNRTFTNYHLSFTDRINNNITWDWYFDYELNFYQDLSDNTFYFVLNVVNKLPQWSFTYNGVTKTSYLTDNYTETLVSQHIVLSTVSFDSLMSFSVSSISSSLDLNYYGQEFSSWVWRTSYKIEYNLSFPYISGFRPYSVSLNSPTSDILPGGYGFLGFSWSTDPNLSGVSGSPSSNSSLVISSYSIDYTKSNYDVGYSDGYSTGYNDGFNVGYESGYSTGYDNGYDVGFVSGVESQQPAIEDAYTAGYNAGYDEGFSTDSTVGTIFSGVLQVGMLPINIFLAIFNFEILGINLSAFISAILTVCLTVIVIRTIKGGND